MRKERKNIGVDRIKLNTGQLEWLPANPRTWTQDDIDKTAASIEEDEDFLEDRPLLVVPFGKEFICFAGNLRHEGCMALKKATAPCVVHYPETEQDQETILRRAMKDNGQFGKTNWDAIYSSKWGTLKGLEKWGLTPPSWETGENETGEGDKEGNDKPDLSDKIDYQFRLEITCESEAEQEAMYNELTNRGYECRILTL